MLLALAVLVAFAAEALSGFGSLVIALTLGAELYPLDELKPVLVPLSLTLTTYVVVRHRAKIDRALLLRRILPFMGAGVALGLLLLGRLDARTTAPLLKSAFGGLVVLFAARELLALARGHAAAPSAARPTPWIVAAGVVHGIFASGGPLLVYGIGRAGLDKAAFRSTLATVWLTLNAALTATYALSGRLGAATLPRIALLIPVVPVAIALGEWAHRRVDERRFRGVVFSLLLVAGGALWR